MYLILRNLGIRFLVYVLCIAFPLTGIGGSTDLTSWRAVSAYFRPISEDSLVLTGMVLDGSDKNPLSGINVAVEGFSATISDNEGVFSLKVPSYMALLKVSGTGYQDQYVPLKGKSEIEIVLYPSSFNSIYKEAVLPLGTGNEFFTPYAVNSLGNSQLNASSDVWESNPNESLESFLQGKISGLNVVRNGGAPRSGGFLSMRGFNSLYASNKPLIIVDDMIYDNEEYGHSLFSDFDYNPLSDLEVKDIENITVLKSGNSTYGTRGANGVILIKTARAKELATRIDFGMYGSYNNTVNNLPVMNPYDYRVYLSDVLKSGHFSSDSIGLLPYMTDSKKDLSYYLYHNQTDWQKEILKNSFNQNYYLKVTGGDNIATYALSVGYRKNESILKGSDLASYYTRFNGDLNLSAKLKASVNLSLTSNKENLFNGGLAGNTNPIYIGLVKSPFLSVNVRDSAGLTSPNLEGYDIFKVSNPVSILDKMQGVNQNYRFLGNVKFEYAFNSTFSLQTLIGTTFDKVQEDIFIPAQGVLPDTLRKGISNNRMGSNLERFYSIYNDTRFKVTPKINQNNKLSANLGLRYNYNKSEDEFGMDHNSATDEFVSLGQGIPELREIGGGIGEWNWLNMYLNADYSLFDKYFASFNLAVDGSSRFGKEATHSLPVGKNKFAVMPSLALGWLISSERFLSDFNALDLLKLRVSVARVGNYDVGDYAARRIYGSQHLLGMEGIVRENFGNPTLRWEQVDQSNLGVDMSFFKERLYLSLDLYKNKTTGMLLISNTTSASGMEEYMNNEGVMRTAGFDASIGSRLINRKLKWDLSLNLGHYKNSIWDLGANDVIYTTFAEATYQTKRGNGANLFYGYKTEGIFNSEDEAANSGLMYRDKSGVLVPFKGGDVHFQDLNGDHIIDESDQTIIGNPNPKLTGGMTNTFTYKNFSLNILFTYSYGNDIFNYTRKYLESQNGFNNQTDAVKNRWRNDGQITTIPRASWEDPSGNNRFSDRWIEDGSYLRLRKVSIGYDVPINKSIVRYIKVYLTGDDLLTFTKYLGYDPEIKSGNSIFSQGIDLFRVPQYKSVQLGVRLGF